MCSSSWFNQAAVLCLIEENRHDRSMGSICSRSVIIISKTCQDLSTMLKNVKRKRAETSKVSEWEAVVLVYTDISPLYCHYELDYDIPSKNNNIIRELKIFMSNNVLLSWCYHCNRQTNKCSAHRQMWSLMIPNMSERRARRANDAAVKPEREVTAKFAPRLNSSATMSRLPVLTAWTHHHRTSRLNSSATMSRLPVLTAWTHHHRTSHCSLLSAIL